MSRKHKHIIYNICRYNNVLKSPFLPMVELYLNLNLVRFNLSSFYYYNYLYYLTLVLYEA